MTSKNTPNTGSLPPVKKKGLPLWVFKLIRCMLHWCPFDAYIVFPLLFLIIIAVLGWFSSFFQGEGRRVVIWTFIGLLATACMAVCAHKHSTKPTGAPITLLTRLSTSLLRRFGLNGRKPMAEYLRKMMC